MLRHRMLKPSCDVITARFLSVFAASYGTSQKRVCFGPSVFGILMSRRATSQHDSLSNWGTHTIT